MCIKRLIRLLFGGTRLPALFGGVAAQVRAGTADDAGGIAWISGGVGFDESLALQKWKGGTICGSFSLSRDRESTSAEVVVIIQNRLGQPVFEETRVGRGSWRKCRRRLHHDGGERRQSVTRRSPFRATGAANAVLLISPTTGALIPALVPAPRRAGQGAALAKPVAHRSDLIVWPSAWAHGRCRRIRRG